jgi:type IV pilus assembly protein PilW
MNALTLGRRQAGFSLVEMMIGLLIGMFAMLAIARLAQVSQGQSRTTGATIEAQNSGALSLLQLELDASQAGYGLTAAGDAGPRLLGCSLELRAGITLDNLGPIAINPPSIPPGDANTDRILIVASSGAGAPEGARIVTHAERNRYGVATTAGFRTKDRVVAAPARRLAPCKLALDQVSAITPATVVTQSGTADSADGALLDFGPAPIALVYAVRGGNLTVCDYLASDCGARANAGNASIWVPIANGIVSLVAQVGRDTSAPPDAIRDVYDQAIPASACAWAGVTSLRLAVVARSATPERGVVTAAAPAWAGSAQRPIDLRATATPAINWQRYRYQVYETTIALRNMIWAAGIAAEGCDS